MSERDFLWYADHATLGEIQIQCDGNTLLFNKAVAPKDHQYKVRLFCPRMAHERLTSEKGSDTRKVETLELIMGDIGMIDPQIRAECSLSVEIPDLEAALLWAIASLPEGFTEDLNHPLHPLLEEMSKQLNAWMVKTWDEATSLEPPPSPPAPSQP